MFVILRKLNGRWSVAVDEVKEEALDRVVTMWRARGYSVLPVRSEMGK